MIILGILSVCLLTAVLSAGLRLLADLSGITSVNRTGEKQRIEEAAVSASSEEKTSAVKKTETAVSSSFVAEQQEQPKKKPTPSVTPAPAEPETEFEEIAAGLKAAETNQQLILVRAEGTQAVLSMLNRESSGRWKEVLHTDAFVGANGVGETTEWSWTTPPGIFDFGVAFGIYPDPGTAFPYTQVNDSHYWVDDVNSEYYNQFVSTDTVPVSWESAEHLIEHDPSYHYSLSINYNTDCVPGVGSAIFLHCERGEPTLGCVSVAEEDMKWILQNIRTDCKIIIDNGDAIRNY